MPNRNNGRYGEDLSKPPSQNAGESRDAYNQRLKEWQRKRSMSGNKQGTGKPKPAATPTKSSASNPGGWMDKVVRALGGDKKD